MELKHNNVFITNLQKNDVNAEERLSSFMRARKRSIIGNGFVMESKFFFFLLSFYYIK